MNFRASVALAASLISILASCALSKNVSKTDSGQNAIVGYSSSMPEYNNNPLQQDITYLVKNASYKWGQMIHGEKAPRAFFRGIAIVKNKLGTCSATLIGPNTLITAAHCVDNGARIGKALSVELTDFSTGDVLSHKCAFTKEYAHDSIKGSARNSNDIALCVLTSELFQNYYDGPSPYFEVVDLNYPVKTNTKILLAGYGCNYFEFKKFAMNDKGEWDYIPIHKRKKKKIRFRPLWIGNDTIDRVYSSSQKHSESLFTSSSTYTTVSPKLCPGDSGGPVFVNVNTRNYASNTKRRVVGVNSGHSYTPAPKDELVLTNNYTNLTAEIPKGFFFDFLQMFEQEQPKICGVNIPPGAENCRE